MGQPLRRPVASATVASDGTGPLKMQAAGAFASWPAVTTRFGAHLAWDISTTLLQGAFE